MPLNCTTDLVFFTCSSSAVAVNVAVAKAICNQMASVTLVELAKCFGNIRRNHVNMCISATCTTFFIAGIALPVFFRSYVLWCAVALFRAQEECVSNLLIFKIFS